MKQIILPALLLLFATACSPPKPEQLAQESCDCFHDAKSHNNSDNQLEATEHCMHVAQSNIERLHDIEKDQDMTPEQVKTFEDRFYKIYNNCQ